MPTLPPITKTQFLEAFKSCDKYIKFNYIEQEKFFYNMVYVMGTAKNYMPEETKSTLDKFNVGLFRRGIMAFLRTLGPEMWRKFDNMAEKMQAEANSHLFAAGTDLAGIVLGAGVGKVASKATKAISRPYAKNLVNVVTEKGNRYNVNVNRLAGTKSVPTQMSASAHFKTRHTVWGTDIFDWRKISTKDTVVNITVNPAEVFGGELSSGVTDYAQQQVTPGETFSFSFGDSSVAEAGNVITDFIPYLGNAKAAVSSVVNLAISSVYSKSADTIAEIEGAGKEATRKYINTHLYVDIEKDLKSLDKKTLFRMLQFVPEIKSRAYESK